MAVCDLSLPILNPLKPPSQLGFTPGLFVKMANIIITEQRCLAVKNNQVLLQQFLDAMAAFDETLHPIIMNQMYNGGVEDDIWVYFNLMHQNSQTFVKWNGLQSDDFISEGKGNRQGGKSSADEWKLYNNKMIEQLERAATEFDKIDSVPTSCVAVADDVAPCATADHPVDAVHQLQNLLYIVEDHGTQLHMRFGVEKCKLLISGRQSKIKQVESLLEDEPGTLTFYGQPVKQVEEYYVHIGVPQATRNQSNVIVDYRISKGQDITYALQNSTRNSLSGISPLSNRKMFNSYHQPSFIYGTDTMSINETDLERLEIKYRDVLRHMLSLPRYTKSSLIYLSIGVLPARGQRDLEILGVFGQLAICGDDMQNIRKVIQNSLTFYDISFNGWSALVRKTCLRYDLPDPLQIMMYPWRPDRWRMYCKEKIILFWESLLRKKSCNLQTS